MATKRAVVLLSGGLDSRTCLAVGARRGVRGPRALGRTTGSATGASSRAPAGSRARSAPRRTGSVKVDLSAFGGSALTDAAHRRAEAAERPRAAREIPVTYVPARNTVLLGLALAHAETIGADGIFVGVNAIDYSGYPDCRPEFLRAFERLARVATKAGVEGQPLRIARAAAPACRRREIVRLGTRSACRTASPSPATTPSGTAPADAATRAGCAGRDLRTRGR